ncbi:hypothetical protein BaRGS_00002913 [Batillaria attramentaria]|uniref:Uncharacterized protein n=1 Tax=Batillaria attramentaria TaxID=370345 RepID=A0ABD0M1Z9_9CAEN
MRSQAGAATAAIRVASRPAPERRFRQRVGDNYQESCLAPWVTTGTEGCRDGSASGVVPLEPGYHIHIGAKSVVNRSNPAAILIGHSMRGHSAPVIHATSPAALSVMATG